MHSRAYCEQAAIWAAQVIRNQVAHLHHGALEYPTFAPRAILFFGNDGGRVPLARHPALAKLREYFAIEEVGIRELGLGVTANLRAWVLLTESRRDAEYCRRLIDKAYRESLASEDREREVPR